MTTDKDYEDFKRYLDIQNSKIRNNVIEVRAEDLEQPYMLHIDIKTPSKFIPMMPRRAASSEDNTLPRVTVADTLLGCFIAYSAILSDYNNIAVQGQYINAIYFDYCLKPNKKLVYDAEETNEHWLVGYNKKTLSYKPIPIGKMFITQVNSDRVTIKGKLTIVFYFTFIIEIEKTIRFSENIKLEPGFYKISTKKNTAIEFDYNFVLKYTDDRLFEITPLSRAEYNKQKQISAALLDVDTKPVPLYSKW